MKQYLSFLFCLWLCIFFSCNGQTAKSVYKLYSVGTITGIEKFNVMSAEELRIAESDATINKTIDEVLASDTTGFAKEFLVKKDSKNNRARIFLSTFTNGKMEEVDIDVVNGLSISCDCEQNNDTIFVQMNVGFFGGAGIKLSLTKNDFHSSYFTYIDHVKPFKNQPSDKEFVGNILVPNEQESLILEQKPSFLFGQQITGYLTFTSNSYYEQSGDDLDKKSVKGNLFFTCKTKRAIPKE